MIPEEFDRKYVLFDRFIILGTILEDINESIYFVHDFDKGRVVNILRVIDKNKIKCPEKKKCSIKEELYREISELKDIYHMESLSEVFENEEKEVEVYNYLDELEVTHYRDTDAINEALIRANFCIHRNETKKRMKQFAVFYFLVGFLSTLSVFFLQFFHVISYPTFLNLLKVIFALCVGMLTFRHIRRFVVHRKEKKRLSLAK